MVTKSIQLIRTVGDTLHITEHVITLVLLCILGYVHNDMRYCEIRTATTVGLIYKA
jgi:hypothetical protein